MHKRAFFLSAAACLTLVAACVALSAPRTAIAGASAGVSVDSVVASVDGSPITMGDVRAFAAASGTTLPDSIVTSSDSFRSALKGVIAQKLLMEEVKKYRDKVEEAQVDRYIQEMEQERGVTDDQLRASLAQSGVSYEDFRKQARFQLEKEVMLNDEVRQKVTVPESQIKAYYKEHQNDFMVQKETYRLAQILIAVPADAPPEAVTAAEQKAEMVRKKAGAEDFATLAREYSDDESRQNGGEMGEFSPDEIMERILDGIRDLKPGQISPVIRSQHGFHIIKLEDHEVPGPLPLAVVRERIRSKLIDQVAAERMEKWVDDELVKQHYVETLY